MQLTVPEINQNNTSIHGNAPTLGRAACLVIAALFLGIAIQINNGLIGFTPIFCLSFSICAVLLSFTTLPKRVASKLRVKLNLALLLNAAIAIQFLQMFLAKPQIALPDLALQINHFGMLGLMVGCWLLMNRRSEKSSLFFFALLVCFGVYCSWMLANGPRPRIDVWAAQTAGLDNLAARRDPWSSSFPNPYKNLPGMYAEGTVVNGMVQLGFPYPPISVLSDLPGYYLFHDFRFSNLVCMIIAAGLIGFSHRKVVRSQKNSRPEMMMSIVMHDFIPDKNAAEKSESVNAFQTAQLSAVLFLTTPRAFLVLQNAWTEATVMMLFAATIFCAQRYVRMLPWILGLLLASKQYLPLAALPAILLLPRCSFKEIFKLFVKAGIAGCIVSVPLIAMNPKGFIHSNLTVAAGAGFRMDAMSYIAFFAGIFDFAPAAWMGSISFIAALLASAFVLKKSDSGPSGFCASVALVFLAYFSLNKFAFCNYYYFLIGVISTAVATGNYQSAVAEAHGKPVESRPTAAIAA